MSVRNASFELATPATPVPERIFSLDSGRIEEELNARGCASTGTVLSPPECAALSNGWGSGELFRSRIVMARHGFGKGEYQYYAYPLPELVAALRDTIYPRLAPIATRWQEMLGETADYPSDHRKYLERCHRAGQRQPTPLLLKYGEGDYNCLHQDIYGDLVFPLQVAFLL